MTNSHRLSLQQPAAPSTSSLLRWPAARQAATFVGLVYLLVVTIALALPTNSMAPMISMVTPVVVVSLIALVRTPPGQRGHLWASLGLRPLGLRSWPAAFGISVILILLVPYGAALQLGSAELITGHPTAASWLNGLTNLMVGLAVATAMALTEEIGWRGYLLPRVQILVSRRRAALVVGFIHGLFHLPLVLLTTTYDSVGSRWIIAPTMVATLTAAGVFYAWLKDRSHSVWPVAFAHGAVNVVIDGAGLVLVISPVALAYTAGEGGIVTFLATAAGAAVLLIVGRTWRAHRTSPPTQSDPAPSTLATVERV